MRLSDFKGAEGVAVVGKLLKPIGAIVANPENKKAKQESENLLIFASALLQNNPNEIMEMLGILSGNPENYQCSAASVLADTFQMITDEQLLQLFGLQMQTQPESTSVTEIMQG